MRCWRIIISDICRTSTCWMEHRNHPRSIHRISSSKIYTKKYKTQKSYPKTKVLILSKMILCCECSKNSECSIYKISNREKYYRFTQKVTKNQGSIYRYEWMGSCSAFIWKMVICEIRVSDFYQISFILKKSPKISEIFLIELVF